jgi:hypothetical protein
MQTCVTVGELLLSTQRASGALVSQLWSVGVLVIAIGVVHSNEVVSHIDL